MLWLRGALGTNDETRPDFWCGADVALDIPNQSSVTKAWQKLDDAGRVKPSLYNDRVVDVMEELVKFTHLMLGRSDYRVNL